jgi:hypothetical protein
MGKLIKICLYAGTVMQGGLTPPGHQDLRGRFLHLGTYNLAVNYIRSATHCVLPLCIIPMPRCLVSFYCNHIIYVISVYVIFPYVGHLQILL